MAEDERYREKLDFKSALNYRLARTSEAVASALAIQYVPDTNLGQFTCFKLQSAYSALVAMDATAASLVDEEYLRESRKVREKVKPVLAQLTKRAVSAADMRAMPKRQQEAQELLADWLRLVMMLCNRKGMLLTETKSGGESSSGIRQEPGESFEEV